MRYKTIVLLLFILSLTGGEGFAQEKFGFNTGLAFPTGDGLQNAASTNFMLGGKVYFDFKGYYVVGGLNFTNLQGKYDYIESSQLFSLLLGTRVYASKDGIYYETAGSYNLAEEYYRGGFDIGLGFSAPIQGFPGRIDVNLHLNYLNLFSNIFQEDRNGQLLIYLNAGLNF